MSKPFPFFKMNFEPMELVCLNLNKMDLFELSLTSKKVLHWIKHVRVVPKSFFVRHSHCNREILVTFDNGHQLAWSFNETVKLPLGTRQMDGVSFTYRRRLETMICGVEDPILRDQLMISVLKHLMSIFPGTITTMHLDFGHNIEARSDFLTYVTEKLGSCVDLKLSGEPNNETVKYIMDNMAIGCEMNIRPCPTQFNDLSIFDDVPELVIGNAEWVEPHHLLAFKSPILLLQRSIFTKAHISTFLESIVRKEAPASLIWWKLQMSEQFTTNELVSSVPHQQFVNGSRDEIFSRFSNEKLGHLDCLEAADILRDDGLLFSVIVTDYYFVNIIAWHDRFPNSTEFKRIEDERTKQIDKQSRMKQTIERNFRKCDEMRKRMDAMKEENERLKAENELLARDANEMAKTSEQFERICGAHNQ